MLAGKQNLLFNSPRTTRMPDHRIVSTRLRLTFPSVLLLWILWGGCAPAAYPLSLMDSSGKEVFINETPRRVVCLSPEITEIIFHLGAGDSLAGVTLHDALPPEAGIKTIVGGFLTPSPSLIASLKPDMLLLSPIHRGVLDENPKQAYPAIEMESRSVADLYRNIELLGRVFGKEAKAKELSEDIRDSLTLISRKVEKTPASRRKRVIRLMDVGPDSLMVPGDDSFQNELIRAAGGIPPQLGKKGEAVYVSLDEWKQFDPEVIYSCGGNRRSLESFLSRPGWKEVRAVREARFFSFPCNLTCRISVQTGKFVSWLASSIYDEEFASVQNRVLEEKTLRKNPVELPLDYVQSAAVVETTISDFTNKTLVVDFTEPMSVISTLEGDRKAISSIGNHYFPPPCWSIEYRQGFEKWKTHTFKALGRSEKNSCLLFTGADMRNLSIQKAEFGTMTVFALVTAGVESNAMRTSIDEGLFYEPGTINIILMTNRRLTPKAMVRAVITATEAKTAAMQDLDIRSSFSPVKSQATGTGTDEVLVVEGRGKPIDDTGGHCKLGELIARAVYGGVKQAVSRQNGITAPRSVFRRLQERNIALYGILRQRVCSGEDACAGKYLSMLEELLLQPRYAAFLESALTVGDAHEKGLVIGLDAFQDWCRVIAEEIAGKKPDPWTDYFNSEDVPAPTKMSLNALLNGLVCKVR